MNRKILSRKDVINSLKKGYYILYIHRLERYMLVKFITGQDLYEKVCVIRKDTVNRLVKDKIIKLVFNGFYYDYYVIAPED